MHVQIRGSKRPNNASGWARVDNPGGDGIDPSIAWVTGRKAGVNDDTTRHLSGRSVRVLAFGLALLPLASRMTTRERAAGKACIPIRCAPWIIA